MEKNIPFYILSFIEWHSVSVSCVYLNSANSAFISIFHDSDGELLNQAYELTDLKTNHALIVQGLFKNCVKIVLDAFLFLKTFNRCCLCYRPVN